MESLCVAVLAGDPPGAARSPARTQPAWAGRFLPAGSSNGSPRRAKIASGDFFTPSVPDTSFAVLLPAGQKSLRRRWFHLITSCLGG